MTLIEVALSTAIIAGLLVSAIYTVTAVKSGGVWMGEFERGRVLAQELLAEIQELPYTDPSQVAAPLGVDADDPVSGHRSSFDDIDDFTGLIEAPPRTRGGLLLSKHSGWKRCVQVEWVDASDLETAVGSESGVKRIRVTVSRGARPIVTLTTVRTAGLPALRACCFSDSSCRELQKEECTAQGGWPGRADEHCWSSECSSGFVAHWKLDELLLSVTARDSVGQHDGDVDGPSWTTGQLGGALSFGGSGDVVEIDHNVALSLTAAVSICGWISVTNTTGEHTMLLKGAVADKSNYWLAVRGSAIAAGFNDGAGEVEFLTSSGTVERKRWTHIAMVLDTQAQSLSIYKDGALAKEWKTTGLPITNTKSLWMGLARTGQYMEGKLDDVRLYSRRLNASEFAEIMTGAK